MTVVACTAFANLMLLKRCKAFEARRAAESTDAKGVEPFPAPEHVGTGDAIGRVIESSDGCKTSEVRREAGSLDVKDL